MSKNNTKSKPLFDLLDDEDSLFNKSNEPKVESTTSQPALPNEPVFELGDDGLSKINMEPFKEPLKDPLKDLLPEAKPNPEISKITGNRNITPEQGEVLKKYILLKEQEVRDLRDQVRQYQTSIKKIQGQTGNVQDKIKVAVTEAENHKAREQEIKHQYIELKERYKNDLERQKNEYEERIRQNQQNQVQAHDLMKQREEWKEKIREDLNRIRLKEKELENKYELLKRDTQTLLESKDKHVLELQKKNDALELELETLEERLIKNNSALALIEDKKSKLIETLKLAISLLEGFDQDKKE